MKKCIYCKCALSEDSLLDFCERCGKNVWGEKMFKAIVSGMKEGKDKGLFDQVFPSS